MDRVLLVEQSKSLAAAGPIDMGSLKLFHLVRNRVLKEAKKKQSSACQFCTRSTEQVSAASPSGKIIAKTKAHAGLVSRLETRIKLSKRCMRIAKNWSSGKGPVIAKLHAGLAEMRMDLARGPAI